MTWSKWRCDTGRGFKLAFSIMCLVYSCIDKGNMTDEHRDLVLNVLR